MQPKSKNVVTVKHRVDQEERWRANKHKGGVLWLTGLPSSGKSTLAIELEHELFQKGLQTYVLDGDNVRQGLSSDLGFAPEDRTENIRRIGEVASLFADTGIIVITAFISPYRDDREIARKAAGDAFHEIHINADVAVCESRDPKGLYKLAREGKIPEFTGISAPYEEPDHPDLVIDTVKLTVADSVGRLIDYVDENFVKPVA